MKRTEFVVVTFAAFLFLMVGPLTARRDRPPTEQRQEEVEEVFLGEDTQESFRVVYRARSMQENSIADILWLKKAAAVALDAGVPHFNVRNRKTTREFNRRLQRRLSVVEGTIELDNDPMSADYDSHEILSLVLPEVPL